MNHPTVPEDRSDPSASASPTGPQPLKRTLPPTARQLGRLILWHLDGLFLKIAIEVLFRGTLKRYRQERKLAIKQGLSEAEMARILIASELDDVNR